jgi:Flp pilus assembly secretin CpaC
MHTLEHIMTWQAGLAPRHGVAWRGFIVCSVLLTMVFDALAETPPARFRSKSKVQPIHVEDGIQIPDPAPIVLDESWMNGEGLESDTQQSGIQKAAFQVASESEIQPPGEGTEGIVVRDPRDDGPVPLQTQMVNQGPLEPAQSLPIPLGEFFNIRAVEQIGKIKQVFTDRDEILLVLGASRTTGTLPKPVDSVRVVGRKLGRVELTLIGERGVKQYQIRITPSVAQIEALVARQFPLSSVEVTAAGDHMLVLGGSVESPGDVDGIVQLVKSFVGNQGEVVNGIQVSGVMQVQLEVIIARIDRAELRRLGLNFQYAGTGGYAGSSIGNIGGITPISSSVANDAAAAGGNAFQSVGGSASSVVTPASTVFFGVTNELHQFMTQIEALQVQGVAKVLAKPILTTLNGRPAEFLVGGEQPYPIQTNPLSSPTVEFKKFGTRLNFVPVILSPDKIRLNLVPEHSSVNFTQALVIGGNQVPQFITQRIHTTVEMEPGQTLVLGGLLQTESDAEVQKVPILGDLPLVGAAFRHVRHQEKELELIVIVTPRLVSPINASECPLPLPGDESRRPTDKELYWHGLPEVPSQIPDMEDMEYQILTHESARADEHERPTAESGTIQQVGATQTDRSPRSWLRLPKWRRKPDQAKVPNREP